MSGREDAPLTSRSSERPISRTVLHHWLSAGVAQLYVRVALIRGVQWMNLLAEMIKRFWSTGSFARRHVCVAASKPTMGRHQSRSSFSEAVIHQFQKTQEVVLMPGGDVWTGRCAPNQSLERTPVEQGCFASPVVCRRRSALRWAPWKAKDRLFQKSAFERRDPSILGSSIPVAVGQCGSECRLVIPESTFGA